MDAILHDGCFVSLASRGPHGQSGDLPGALITASFRLNT